jgi:protein SCO1
MPGRGGTGRGPGAIACHGSRKVLAMRFAVLFLGLLLYCTTVLAAGPGRADLDSTSSAGQGAASQGASQGAVDQSSAGQSTPLFRATGNGAFRLELSLSGSRLELGPNALDLTLRDQAGLALEGAQVAITPWMPSMGHGVWDKPLVTEQGGGKYHVENVKVIMGGRWELRVSVKKGTRSGEAIFPFDVKESEQAAPEQGTEQGQGYDRSVTGYTVPNVTLLTQDGDVVRLKSLTDSGRPVVLTFIFTSCTTVCPILSAVLADLRSELGRRASQVQIISVTIDPEHDRPEVLKQYGSRFNAGEGWTFLTGTRDEIGRVLQAFDALIVDKMSHEPLYFLRGPNSDQWIRIRGVVSMGDLLNEFQRIENK